MQSSVVDYSYIKKIIDFRIDAECYKPQHLLTEKIILGKSYKTVKELSKTVINFGAYSLCNYIEFLESGIPFIVTEDINNNLIDNTNFHFISKDVHKILHKSHCRKGQILLTMAGAYLGQAAVYNFDFIASSNQAIAKITLNDTNIDPFYVSTFLNSSFGQSQISRFRTGTGQPNLNLGLIQDIKIPLLNNSFQLKIREVVLKGIEINEKCRNIHNNAQEILLQELNLEKWKPIHKLAFVKNYSKLHSDGRMDAEYYQPMYDEIEKKILKYKNGTELIKSQFNQNKKSFKIDLNQEYNYVEIGCVSTSDGSITPLKIAGDELPANAKIKMQKNDVVVSKVRPYRGAIGIINSNNCIGSGAFTVLQENGKINKETLFVYLRTKPMLQYSLKYNTGTSYPTIIDDDILNYRIPLFEDSIQKKVKEKIEEAINTKVTSKKLLEMAKCGVEKAIEENEEVAEKWINEGLKKIGEIDGKSSV